MGGILSEILGRKREVVARLRADPGARDFRDRALATRADANPHALLEALVGTPSCGVRSAQRADPTTVNPPKLAGAALSGCPSESVHNLKRVSRSSGSPLSRFSPSSTPRRTVALLPRPRHRGICSTIEHENENARRRACLKNRSAASDTIVG